MGFFSKLNPRATRKSVVRSAAVGSAVGLAVAVTGLLRTDWPFTAWFFMPPWMAFVGAVAGAAIEWQMPGPDDNPPG